MPHDEDIINPISPSPLAHQNGVAYKLDHVSLEQLTLALLDKPVALRLTWIILECGTISELLVLLTWILMLPRGKWTVSNTGFTVGVVYCRGGSSLVAHLQGVQSPVAEGQISFDKFGLFCWLKWSSNLINHQKDLGSNLTGRRSFVPLSKEEMKKHGAPFYADLWMPQMC